MLKEWAPSGGAAREGESQSCTISRQDYLGKGETRRGKKVFASELLPPLGSRGKKVNCVRWQSDRATFVTVTSYAFKTLSKLVIL